MRVWLAAPTFLYIASGGKLGEGLACSSQAHAAFCTASGGKLGEGLACSSQAQLSVLCVATPHSTREGRGLVTSVAACTGNFIYSHEVLRLHNCLMENEQLLWFQLIYTL